MTTKKTTKTPNNLKIKSDKTSPSLTPADNLNLDNPEKDYKVLFISDDHSTADTDEIKIITAESIQKQSEQWMYQALEHFDNGGKQYSVIFNESSSSSSITTDIDELKELALNAQNDLSKVLKINMLVRQASTEDDIIGKVHEAVEANLNSNVRLSFDSLPDNYDKDLRLKAENEIKRFHKEVNINEVMTNAITTTYDEGTCIQYMRSKKHKNIYHHTIDRYPLGVAIVSDYSENTIPRILIDINELTNRLQKTTLKSKKNKPLFFNTLAEEIKNNYPQEIIEAYVNRERYAKLDLRRTGTNRFGNLNRKYGISPIFKALKPKMMLDTIDKSDAINAKAKSKKIILQTLRKETMGTSYEKKGLEDMAYAHNQLALAWKNPTVLYTAPPCVENVAYVEPKVEMTNESTIIQYRSRVTSALGISFLNTDGQQTVSTANISIKQLMKTINKIAERQEIILQRWYEIVLEEAKIPIEYCPTPHILDSEMLEFDMQKDLAEFLFSKLNCSYRTAYETLGFDFKNEYERRMSEIENGIDTYFVPHKTSYNSSGDDVSDGGRPLGSTENGNEVNEKKQEYDANRQESKT